MHEGVHHRGNEDFAALVRLAHRRPVEQRSIRRDLDGAAQRAAAVRADIFTLDALAWALFRSGRVAEAATAIEQALRTGTKDRVIPIEVGGDIVAERLRQEGYRVVYRRFAGGHRPVPAIAARFVRAASR